MVVPHKLPFAIRTCRSTDSLGHVAEIMCRCDCSCVMIVDSEGCPVGVITESALVTAASNQEVPLAQLVASKAESHVAFARRGSHSPGPVGRRRAGGDACAIPLFDDAGSLVNVIREDRLAPYLRTAWHQE